MLTANKSWEKRVVFWETGLRFYWSSADGPMGTARSSALQRALNTPGLDYISPTSSSSVSGLARLSYASIGQVPCHETRGQQESKKLKIKACDF
jgi:hypothetical protein